MINKIVEFNKVDKFFSTIKKKGKKIILCHGVFDLVHIGHIKYFEEAKKHADVLVVSLTPDKFIFKGPGRPFFNNQQRLHSVSSLEIVDFVVLNDSSDAIKLIKKIKPDIYFKGQDYKDYSKDITGKISLEEKSVKSIGGRILFSEQEMFSSSSLLNKFTNVLNDNQKKYLKLFKSGFNIDNFVNNINDLKNLNVLVIGEAIIDEYVFCEALGKSGKESVLALREQKHDKYLGGVLPIAKNIANFCDNISLISYLGEKNEEVNFIKKNLDKKIKTFFVNKEKSPTIIKRRYLDKVDRKKILGIYKINDDEINQAIELKILNKLKKNIKKFDLVLVADYGHGLITKNITKFLIKHSKFLVANAQVNSSNISYHNLSKYNKVNALVINASELRQELRSRDGNIQKLTTNLKQVLKLKNILVTKGKDGAILINQKNKLYECPAFANNVVDKVGAGDTLLALFSIFKASKKFSDEVCLFVASLAAGYSVQNLANELSINKNFIIKSIQHLIK